MKFALSMYSNSLLFVLLRIKILSIIKEIFVLDLKQGKELMIPKELRMDHLPMSFRFYDPIIKILQLNIDDDTKYQYNIRSQIHKSQIINGNFVAQFVAKLLQIDDKPYHMVKRAHLKNLP